MKIKIKFLVAFSCIPLSCNNLTKANMLQTGNKQRKSGHIRQKQDIKNNNQYLQNQYLQTMNEIINKIGTNKSQNNNKLQNNKRRLEQQPYISPDTNHSVWVVKGRALFEKHQDKPLFASNKAEMYELCYLFSKYQNAIQQHNNLDYRRKSTSLYPDPEDHVKSHSQHLKYHNQFFNYFNQINPVLDWTSSITSPLTLAVFSKCPDLVSDFIQYLLNNNKTVDLSKKVLFGISILDYVIVTHDLKMFEVLVKEALELYSNREDKAWYVHYILHHTICCGIPEMLDCLLQAGADLNWLYNGKRADEYGNVFWLTVKYDRKDMALYLLELHKKQLHKSINWNQQDEHGRTPLMWAAYNRYPGWATILDKLLSIENVNVAQPDEGGQNILMLLLERYIDICRKFYASYDTFKAGYTYTNYMLYRSRDIFELLYNDKKEMLKSLLKHKDLLILFNQEDKNNKTIDMYVKKLCKEIRELDKKQEIINICMGMYAYAYARIE